MPEGAYAGRTAPRRVVPGFDAAHRDGNRTCVRLPSSVCSSRSMPPTASWSSSRPGGGRSPADDAARTLFALKTAPTALARSLLDDVVVGDARLAWRGAAVGLAAPPGGRSPRGRALRRRRPRDDRALAPDVAHLRDRSPARPRARARGRIRDARRPARRAARGGHVADGDPLGGASRRTALRARRPAVPRVCGRRGDRRAQRALRSRVPRPRGRAPDGPPGRRPGRGHGLAGPAPARRADAARRPRGAGPLLRVPPEPCHRALPDARATAEILVVLVGLAQERGARTLADLVELAAPRARRLHVKRSLVAGAPPRPGVYVFRGRGRPAAVCRAGARPAGTAPLLLRGGRQRPAVEAALAALEPVEWHETGSELDAALEELRLLRELRPPANARSTRPDRHVYLSRHGGRWKATTDPTPLGPLPGRRLGRLAARALDGTIVRRPWQPRCRPSAADATPGRALRFEDAARLRDRLAASRRPSSP